MTSIQRVFILSVCALLGFFETSSRVMAAANGATPTTEPPSIGTCRDGAVLIDLGSLWETEKTSASIIISLVDYEAKSSRLIEIGELNSVVLTIEGMGPVSSGQEIEVKSGDSLKGSVELVADAGSITIGSFGESNKDCTAHAELTR